MLLRGRGAYIIPGYNVSASRSTMMPNAIPCPITVVLMAIAPLATGPSYPPAQAASSVAAQN